MDLYYLWGTDTAGLARRVDSLCANAPRVERVDVAAGPTTAGTLAERIGTPSLLGDAKAVVVCGADSIDSATFAAINARCASMPGGPVVFVAAKRPDAGLRRCVRRLKVEVFQSPTVKTFPKFVEQEAARVGVRLDVESRTELLQRCAGNPERARSVLTQLAVSGVRHPKPRQVRLLCGSAKPESAPWDVTDAVERGDLGAAVAAAERCDAFAFLGWLRKRVQQIEAAKDTLGDLPCDVRPATAVASRLSVQHWQAQRLVRVARSVDSDGVAALWEAVVGLEHRLRSTGVDPAAAVLIAVAQYHCGLAALQLSRR